MRLRPEVREFIRNRRWVHRGDVITYGPNIRCDSFSTDAAGFRHSVFGGKALSAHDCLQSERYGLVLGPSNVYGFGLAGNENTMPSLLAERFGFPFANIGLPEGNSRNLFAILTAFMARAPRPPAAVVHISGGDFTNFCYTSVADPIFGSPNLLQMRQVIKERGGRTSPDAQIKPLLAFTALWIGAIARLCRMNKVPLVLGDDTTFFEKTEPSATDLECELGKAINAAQERQFAIHKKFVGDYSDRRISVAKALGVPLAGPGRTNNIGFIDEFHYDRDGTRALCDDFAEAIQTLL
ncbi:hypothetical protein LVY65_07305 [Sphingomonas sp. G124]|uniref:Uncharacterized protein n=1 Tax=Sphingomonas cremea TaxID=2904799 RepID=A0A9X1TX77_9SPHN|nr:hypothetical protein [Sphingomonas cremea]MCF2514870.1 hypothetical protein [Sphingomonas cremea]